jgi:anthranilate phosphoribosyltransferase
MSIQHHIKTIGRGARGAQALNREQAAELMGEILDGRVADLALGAFCVAMRIKGETADEMCGFVDAAQARLQGCRSADATRPLIVIPSYNGARRLPLLTPLLALLLAQRGLPVWLHGMATESGRSTSAEVLQALGIPALTAAAAIAPGQVAYQPTATLHPGLAHLLATRQAIGLRSSGHSLVKLLAPNAGQHLLLGSYTHADYHALMGQCYTALQRNAMLSRGLEGEVAADPRRSPRYEAWLGGQHQVLQEQAPGTASEVAGLPSSFDVASCARYTQAVLAGQLPVPDGLQSQIQHIVDLCAASCP